MSLASEEAPTVDGLKTFYHIFFLMHPQCFLIVLFVNRTVLHRTYADTRKAGCLITQSDFYGVQTIQQTFFHLNISRIFYGIILK